MSTQAPTYFRLIHGWNIGMAGLFSGFPLLFKLTFSIAFSAFIDYLLRSNRMTRTNARKFGSFLSTIGQGICVLALAYSGTNQTMAVIWYAVAHTLHGSGPAGPLATKVDLSPNFAGVIFGITATVTATTGYITPYIVGLLTLNNVSTHIVTEFGLFFTTVFVFITANSSAVAIYIFDISKCINCGWHLFSCVW